MAALEILVVTTRQSRRWIVPKGWPIKRLPPTKSAAREAFEEAGVRGKIGARAIGIFRYTKAADETGAEADCEVKIFPLLVRRQSATWPEFGQRVVQWVDPEKAISAHPGARAEVNGGEVREARGRRGEQTHLLTTGAAAAP